MLLCSNSFSIRRSITISVDDEDKKRKHKPLSQCMSSQHPLRQFSRKQLIMGQSLKKSFHTYMMSQIKQWISSFSAFRKRLSKLHSKTMREKLELEMSKESQNVFIVRTSSVNGVFPRPKLLSKKNELSTNIIIVSFVCWKAFSLLNIHFFPSFFKTQQISIQSSLHNETFLSFSSDFQLKRECRKKSFLRNCMWIEQCFQDNGWWQNFVDYEEFKLFQICTHMWNWNSTLPPTR